MKNIKRTTRIRCPNCGSNHTVINNYRGQKHRFCYSETCHHHWPLSEDYKNHIIEITCEFSSEVELELVKQGLMTVDVQPKMIPAKPVTISKKKRVKVKF